MLVRIIIREEIGVPQDAFLLVSVGELNKNKNHSVIIKALSALAFLEDSEGNSNDSRCSQDSSKDGEDSTIGTVHYAIAGRGNLDLNAVAVQYGVEKQVHLLGYRNDIPALYMAADVCVFPSIREGLGLAAIEGMASGLPLIVADNRGTRDFVVNGENGIVCRYDDVEGFAKAIKTLKMGLKENNGSFRKMVITNYKRSIKFSVLRVDALMKASYILADNN